MAAGPSRACSWLHQVRPPCSRASERGRWMPQWAQRTMASGAPAAGGLAVPRGLAPAGGPGGPRPCGRRCAPRTARR
ncbi:hypothetical protein HPS44_10450 [Achromobacter xylosoxidans]|nr:hypothetical protein HPS44_10450 [Achromobacter xylosoxidans]